MVIIDKRDDWGRYRAALTLIETVRAGVNGQTPATVSRSLESESEWVISIRGKVNNAGQEHSANPWSKRCIYRIPLSLREGNDKGYLPQIVSIGPYHHNRKRFQNMVPHKRRAVSQILKRTNQDIKLYLGAMKTLQEKARACYEGPISLSIDEFVEMMVLDGCFILEMFRGVAVGFIQLGYSKSDPVFSTRGSLHSIQRDMIMLENQIPLFVLDRLFGIQIGLSDHKGTVSKLALRFFDPLMPTDEPLTTSDRQKLEISTEHMKKASFDPLANPGGEHCLEVFRRSILRIGPQPTPGQSLNKPSNSISSPVADKRRQQLIHCVTELSDAGINFKKRKTDRFWDIRFEKGVLEIPRLLIHDGTRSLFLNLMAFEQCHIDSTKYITSYVIFMDNLINSAEDVRILHYCGIIEHWLGSDTEVADLFNRLCREVVFDIKDSNLCLLSERVNRYCGRRWNTWRATLCHTYFNSPWAIISFFAALVLLLLTFTQTFYAVYAYYRPPS